MTWHSPWHVFYEYVLIDIIGFTLAMFTVNPNPIGIWSKLLAVHTVWIWSVCPVALFCFTEYLLCFLWKWRCVSRYTPKTTTIIIVIFIVTLMHTSYQCLSVSCGQTPLRSTTQQSMQRYVTKVCTLKWTTRMAFWTGLEKPYNPFFLY